LKPFRGDIKGILTGGRFVGGIGNACADGILWTAHIHLHCKKAVLTPEEPDRCLRGCAPAARRDCEGAG
jgi:formamidopyrimidine-DNA glycosylase